MLFKSITLLLFSAVLLGICNGDKIPKPSEKAKMGRYIIHTVEWISIATISTLENVKSYPFVNVKSVADGPIHNGTGIPYLLMTDMDLSGRDVLSDNRVTVLATLAEVDYCKSRKYDPQDPRCGRLILTGKLIKILEGTEEYNFGQSALLSKHPIIKLWEKVHKFYIAKIDIEQVCVLDYFGGASFIPVKEYLETSNDYYSNNDILVNQL